MIPDEAVEAAARRKFWEYIEPDGTRSNLRLKFLAWGVAGGAALGFLGALIGFIGLTVGPPTGLHPWTFWPAIPLFAACGAAGAIIANAIDYFEDKRKATQ